MTNATHQNPVFQGNRFDGYFGGVSSDRNRDENAPRYANGAKIATGYDENPGGARPVVGDTQPTRTPTARTGAIVQPVAANRPRYIKEFFG